MRRLAFAAAIGCVLGAGLARTSAETSSFTLDVAATAQDVQFTVKDQTTVPIKIVHSGTATAGSVDLNLTPFTNEQGLVAPVTLSIPGKDPDTHFDKVDFQAAILAVTLHIPALAPGSKYSGRLVLTPNPASTQAPTVWRFVLTAAKDLRPATLVVGSQNAFTLTAVRSWCLLCNCLCLSSGDEPTIAIQLRDKNGTQPIEGVMLRVEGGLKAPGPDADIRRNLRIDFNDSQNVDLFAPPASGERNIAPHGQATVKLTFHDLGTGEYTIPLQFSAMNSGDDSSQRVTITLQVRNHAGWAVLVLIFAALVSFIATRVVTTLKQRATFLSTVRSMRPYWLAGEPSTLPVIWLRSTLRQAEQLSSRYWLTGQSEIDAKLTAAKNTLAVVARVHEVRGRVSAISRLEVRRRALWRLDLITQTIPAGPLSDPDVARIKTELDRLDGWADPQKTDSEYWNDLKGPIENRRGEVKPDAIVGGKDLATTLWNKLDAAIKTTPAQLDDKIATEIAYQHLTILWQRRDDPERRDEIIKLGGTATIQQIFKINDDADWKRLKSLPVDQCEVIGPSDDTIEAYDPVLFEFRIPGDPALGGTYLVQQKLTYTWTVTITNARTGEERTLRLESKQPKISQYSPVAGTMKASVEVRYNGELGKAATQRTPTAIRASSDFRVWWIIEAADAWSFAVALLIGLASGLQAKGLEPTFGTLKDYLMLFAWGASVDQGKNFIQALSNYKSQKV